MGNYNGITIIIPSLNPDEKLVPVVEGLIARGFNDIIIVNDGSSAEHVGFFPDTGKYPECTILLHEVNRGKGAALKTAFKYVIDNRSDCIGVVTVDGDGQHRAEDVCACAEKLKAFPDTLILGVRDFSQKDVPRRSRIGNRITSFVFRFGCGLKISDTQTGLRAIPSACLPGFLKIKGDRFEYETNMLLELRVTGTPYMEQKISTVYIEENKTSHFHPLRDSWRIYKLILAFMLSSLSAALIDLAVFYVMSVILVNKTAHSVIISTVAARVISSAYNYAVNKKLVFGVGKNTPQTIVRYYILVIGIMAASAGSVQFISMALSNSVPELLTLIKFIVDTALFLFSFTIQREWVFKKSR
ncbi:MAG: bifunctional glycosyltransferase family 2/GtrA family protein [Firmicutes bacterium]|nr:bifunctional glycosyltransferase family 2/GtrA family protein [Bacillota bacterium]